MSKKGIEVGISFERGRIPNVGLIQTKIFLRDRKRKKEKRISPNTTIVENRTNQARDHYNLGKGKYRLETIFIKHGQRLSCTANIIVDSNGKVAIEGCRGNFRPRFAFCEK